MFVLSVQLSAITKISYNSLKVVEDMYQKDMPEKEFISTNFYLYKK